MPPVRAASEATVDARILDAVRSVWGFDTLRPLQAEAISAVLNRRDSLVVMPTGGGKSLCYQVPPLVTGELTVVVSPLISLMKDQVDGLRLTGYPAAALHSNLTADEAREFREQLNRGELRLLLVAPERLLSDSFLPTIRSLNVGTFAIDEAHCISQWGHDFRPEYRRLSALRRYFPQASVHAYTATATPRVRQDIAAQLHLRDHVELVGVFDRPNLTYRIVPRTFLDDQVVQTLDRHREHACIIYCISRRDTEGMADMLNRRGIQAAAYHAGMNAADRRQVQEDFSSERLNVVVATVAFGMGIDRSDVRCIIHAAMPKSVEHYQQETGRAGRDGLPAECVLFYSAADMQRWRQLIEKSAGEIDFEDDEAIKRSQVIIQAQSELLSHIHRLCTGARCRHRALSEYFGQRYVPPAQDEGAGERAGERATMHDSEASPPLPRGFPGCGACDICLGELDTDPESTLTARKIVSCVARISMASNGLSFGVAHVADVLRGKGTVKIVERRHNELSTFGLLAELPRETIISYINQLVDAGFLARTMDQYPVLQLTKASADLLRGGATVALVSPRRPESAYGSGSRAGRASAGGVGGGGAAGAPARPLTAEETMLFESLRALRRSVADELGVPPYVVFSDVTLEEMARVRPSSPQGFVNIRGIGAAKLSQFGERFIAHIRVEAGRLKLGLDAAAGSRPRRDASPAPTPRPESGPLPPQAVNLFRRGASIEEAAQQLGRSTGTVVEYLARYILRERPPSVEAWVDSATYEQVAAAAREAGTEMLRPLFERLGGRVPYAAIKIVLAHRRAVSSK